MAIVIAKKEIPPLYRIIIEPVFTDLSSILVNNVSIIIKYIAVLCNLFLLEHLARVVGSRNVIRVPEI